MMLVKFVVVCLAVYYTGRLSRKLLEGAVSWAVDRLLPGTTKDP